MSSFLKNNGLFRVFWILSHALIWSGGMALAYGLYRWFYPDLDEIRMKAFSMGPILLGTWGIYYAAFHLREGANQQVVLEGEKIRGELYLLRALTVGWLLGVNIGSLASFSNGIAYAYLLLICVNAFLAEKGTRRGPDGDGWVMGIVTLIVGMALFYFMGVWGWFQEESMTMRITLGALIGVGLGGLTSWPLGEIFKMMETPLSEETKFSVRPLTFSTRLRQWESWLLIGITGLSVFGILNLGFRPCGKFDLIIPLSHCRAEFIGEQNVFINYFDRPIISQDGSLYTIRSRWELLEFDWTNRDLFLKSVEPNIAGIAFSPEGKFKALDRRDIYEIQVFQTDTEKLLFSVNLGEGYLGYIRMIFSSNESHFGFASADIIQIWSLEPPELMGKITIEGMEGFSVSPNGDQVAILIGNKIQLFRSDGNLIREIALDDWGDGIAFTENGNELLIQGYQELFVVDLQTDTINRRTQVEITDDDFTTMPVFSPDGSYILAVTRWQAYIFSWPELKLLKNIKLTEQNPFGEREVAISPDGLYFATAYGHKLQIWEIPNLEP